MISIVIPTYNCEAYLEELFDSIIAQTFTEYEVIVVDDGSTDDTEALVKRYAGIQYIKLPDNQGPQYARNRGYEEANGEYLIFMDADVLLGPTYLEKLKIALDSNLKAGFSYCDRVIAMERNGGPHMIRRKSGPVSMERLSKGNSVSFCSLVRREAIKGFDMNLNRMRLQDWEFWLSILSEGWTGAYVPEYLFLMYLRPDGLSSNMATWNSSVEYVVEKYKIGAKR